MYCKYKTTTLARQNKSTMKNLIILFLGTLLFSCRATVIFITKPDLDINNRAVLNQQPWFQLFNYFE